jgi:thiamine-phosphate pyrophosphorylase
VSDIDALQALAAARLYLVCGALPFTHLRAALDGGVDLVQLRLKDAGDAEVIELGRRYVKLCAQRGVPLVLNDRPELVQDVGADGVHVGQDDAPVAKARELVGERRIVGLSTHTPSQIRAAAEEDADYIGVGPVYATPTKPGRAAVGLELVRYAAEHAGSPFFAIGGLDVDRVDAVLGAGARRIAVVRAIGEAEDPRRAARALRELVEQAAASVGHA